MQGSETQWAFNGHPASRQCMAKERQAVYDQGMAGSAWPRKGRQCMTKEKQAVEGQQKCQRAGSEQSRGNAASWQWVAKEKQAQNPRVKGGASPPPPSSCGAPAAAPRTARPCAGTAPFHGRGVIRAIICRIVHVCCMDYGVQEQYLARTREQTWTVLSTDGPNHRGLWCRNSTFRNPR